MGWMWASPASKPAEQANTTTTTTTSTTTTVAPASSASSDHVDAELANFMALIQADLASPTHAQPRSQPPPAAASPPRPPLASEPAPKKTSAWFSWVSPSSSSSSVSTPSSTTSDSQLESSRSIPTAAAEASSLSSSSPSPEADTAPSSPTSVATPGSIADSLLPTTMSCRQAFDTAFHCNGLGGQWISVYRHGSVRTCSEKWDDFWFCMRTRAVSGPVKENMIKEHYRRRELDKYGPGKPSSEDVWESRTERVKPGTVFNAPYEDPDDISDEEWRKREMERRRLVREQLGYNDDR